MVCSGLIDIKPANILIEYNDAEAAVQSHLQQHAGPSDLPPHQMLSEALTATDASAASIKIRIVDFGVGKSSSLSTRQS
jgi:serine/threonine protein kinase